MTSKGRAPQVVDHEIIKKCFDYNIYMYPDIGYVNIFRRIAEEYNKCILMEYELNKMKGLSIIDYGVAIRACQEAGCDVDKVKKKKSEKKPEKSSPVNEFIIYMARKEYKHILSKAKSENMLTSNNYWKINDTYKWNSINTVRGVLGLPKLQPIDHPSMDYFDEKKE